MDYRSFEAIIREKKPIHLCGIGGVSMRALARYLFNRGANVRGSDRDESADTKKLESWQILVDASENTEDLCIDYRQFEPVSAYAIRLRILGSPKDITPGLTSLTVFGLCE